MTMPTPKCPTCGGETGELEDNFVCKSFPYEHWSVRVVDAQDAYIATLEAENTALRQQLAEARADAEQVRGMGEEATKDKKFRGITTYKYLGKNHTAT